MRLPHINLRGVEHKMGLPIPDIYRVKHRLWFLTYTLMPDAIEELNGLVAKNIHVQGVCGKLYQGAKPNFLLRFDEKCHSKVWVVDNRVFVGSSNLSGDTIFNLMVEIKDKRADKIADLVQDICTGGSFQPRTIIL